MKPDFHDTRPWLERIFFPVGAHVKRTREPHAEQSELSLARDAITCALEHLNNGYPDAARNNLLYYMRGIKARAKT